jgi:hypothetical protein
MQQSQFPDITSYLDVESNCYQATLEGNRNLAQVLLDIYQQIPDELGVKEEYKNEANQLLITSIYTAPEMYRNVWVKARNMLNKILTPYMETDWGKSTMNIFAGNVTK